MILQIVLRLELLLVACLLVPLLMTRFLIKRSRYLSALRWAKITLATGRVLPFWRGIGNLNVAACYIGADDCAAALPHAERAVAFCEKNRLARRKPNYALSLAYLGIAQFRAGQQEQAEQRLEAALALNIRNPRIRAMTEIYAAGIYLNRGRLAEAGLLMERTLASPKLGDDYRLAAESTLALQKYFSEDFAGSLAMARQAMQGHAATPALWVNAAVTAQNCLVQLGELAEAQALEAGILARVDDAPLRSQGASLRGSANLALKLGNLDRARELAERAAALDPLPNAQAGAMLIQAEVFAQRQNFQRAASLTDAVLRSDAIDFYKVRARALQARLSA